MIPRSGFSVPDLVFQLSQSGSIKVSGYGRLETVQVMSAEALSAPGPLAPLGVPTGRPIVRTDNPRLERDMFLTA